VAQSFRYTAFISYSHADRRIARWLHKALETYRLPASIVGQPTPIGPAPAKLTPIFRDRDELPAAGELNVELYKALEQSQFLIVIASPDSARSRWVNEEVRYFKQHHGEARVLVVISDGVPGAGDATECFGPALLRKVDDSGVLSDQPAEPLAADARPNGDGKRLVRLKLVAGLTGVPLGQLVRRDEVRKQRKLIGYATAATVLAVSMTVLAALAVRGQIEADRQRAEADGLVEFMLTDLRMQLEPVGRLEIFNAVGQRAMDYYANQQIDALDADSLGRRARALHLVGEVRDLQADSESALVAFDEARDTTAELLERDPEHPNRIFDHSQSTFWVGYIAWQRGDLEAAERHFREYNRLAGHLVEIDPDNTAWQVEESSSLVNLGVLLHYENRNPEAIEYFQRSLAIIGALANADPDDLENQWKLAQGHAWLADALQATEALSAAMDQRRKEQAVYAGILAVDDRDARALEGSAIAALQIANLTMLKGEYGPALDAARTGREQILQLIETDPTNGFWQDTAVQATNRTVEALMLAGDWPRARELNRIALRGAQDMVDADATLVSRTTNGLMNARWMEIAISFALEENEQARAQLLRFHEDFGNDPGFSKQDAALPWSMIHAVEAVDAHSTGQAALVAPAIAAIRGLDTVSPRVRAVLVYLQAFVPEPLPADVSATQAEEVSYDPALILTPGKEIP
jgi:tetratricopeptide (TPR) repeat protein